MNPYDYMAAVPVPNNHWTVILWYFILKKNKRLGLKRLLIKPPETAIVSTIVPATFSTINFGCVHVAIENLDRFILTANRTDRLILEILSNKQLSYKSVLGLTTSSLIVNYLQHFAI